MSVPIHPNANISSELTADLKIAIADAIVVSSRIETCLLETIWVIEDADLNQKRKLATRTISQNFTQLRQFINIPNLDLAKTWRAVDRVMNERHIIAHGSWMIVDNTRPFVIWHKFLENSDTVVGEYFNYHRFAYFMKTANH